LMVDTMMNSENAVADRYSAAAQEREAALCCPVIYDPQYLKLIPDEIIERDYGCGDPTAYVRPGDTVVDLGSGGGKLCYIASQVVGSKGRVIGVDCNQEMLELARKYQQAMAETIGHGNVEFRFGRIQDLALDLDALAARVDAIPSTGSQRTLEILKLMKSLRHDQPMIQSSSVDCVISNCVLNLVDTNDRFALFREIHRVLKNGGRAAISDIVCDEDVPPEMQADGHLWSGCISGAWREDLFLKQFEDAGFYGVSIDKYQEEPWQVINGIEFRSMTVMAYKGKEGACLERNQAVVYKGPFKFVKDDDGHVYARGERVAVCDKTYNILMREPYAGQFLPVEPAEAVPVKDAIEFNCSRSKSRHPRETKGIDYNETRISTGGVCGPGNCC
jgi:arsenite methyltransferase